MAKFIEFEFIALKQAFVDLFNDSSRPSLDTDVAKKLGWNVRDVRRYLETGRGQTEIVAQGWVGLAPRLKAVPKWAIDESGRRHLGVGEAFANDVPFSLTAYIEVDMIENQRLKDGLIKDLRLLQNLFGDFPTAKQTQYLIENGQRRLTVALQNERVAESKEKAEALLQVEKIKNRPNIARDNHLQLPASTVKFKG